MNRRLAAALIAAAAVLPFAAGARGGFVYDDHPIVERNRALDPAASWKAVLALPHWNERESLVRQPYGLYRPLTLATFRAQRAAHGPRPWAFRLINLLLHALNALLVLALARRLEVPEREAVLAALAFAVLPVHAEAVSWIVGRAELLAAGFSLGTLTLAAGERRPGRLAAALALYLLAMLSKESAAALPAGLIVADLRLGARRRLGVYTAFAAVLALYLQWRWLVLGAPLATGTVYFDPHPSLAAALTMARFYFRGWLLPLAGFGLRADWSRPSFPDSTPGDVVGWIALAFWAAAAVIALRRFRAERRSPVFGPILLVALALPATNLLVTMGVLGAERILYLPSVGFCLAAAWALAKAPRWAAAAVLLFWGGRAAVRAEAWTGDRALWSAEVAAGNRSPNALARLGKAVAEAGDRPAARRLFEQALAVTGRSPEAEYNLARMDFEDGDRVAARKRLLRLQHDRPGDPDTLTLLGVVAEADGHPDLAEGFYRSALAEAPHHATAGHNLRALLLRTRRTGRPSP